MRSALSRSGELSRTLSMSAHRCGVMSLGWLIMLAAIPFCAAFYRFFAPSIRESEGLRFFAVLPMVMSLILAMAYCNFTDRSRRDGIAGFPRHLFVLPLKTPFLVACAVACSLVSVIFI